MQIYPNRFAAHISKSISPFYLVFGDEPLQKLLTIEHIRREALTLGFDERQQLSVDNQFNWNSLVEATQTLSLFSSKQFIEIELPTGKPGAEGSKILTALAEHANQDTIIVLHGQKIGKDVQNAKWFKALDKQGIYVPCFPLEGNNLQQWILNYMRDTGIHATPGASKLLSDYCEGNLLAAKQEVDKLLLLYPDGQIDESIVEKAVVDQSRFTVFQLIDVILEGDGHKVVKMLYRLEAEGIEPTIVAWALVREWQTLNHLMAAQKTGQAINWNQHRIWKNRQGFYISALRRLNQAMLDAIQAKLQIFDQRIKQTQVIRPYVELCHICLLFIPYDLQSLPMD
ncbi:DNA polymerase III subunit delta [Aliiglaciecola sp. LCG003]|uniref:DNA polymerase III subunit delta n=1 Tax=Aliiglaciecola sp. LCG003 TaxID=3053655 RepID=UPI002573DF0D|nr:DNA polymerase III subunit delta [Aliiglaciecola sp. LCG003]WJG07820.1 DNA polymerase III subunit delta [Aliiglaciecola sp. LCG003]